MLQFVAHHLHDVCTTKWGVRYQGGHRLSEDASHSFVSCAGMCPWQTNRLEKMRKGFTLPRSWEKAKSKTMKR